MIKNVQVLCHRPLTLPLSQTVTPSWTHAPLAWRSFLTAPWGSRHTNKNGTWAYHFMPMAKPSTNNCRLALSLYLRTKQIRPILHKLTCFFVSSSHSFLYYSELNAKSDQKTKLSSIEIFNCLLTIA